ncbi:Dipeptidyl aminopeptidase/acylaminoacyl peptidase [Micromonospora citrea]|uniref:Dipeptidyl aminopeptidase/acylaminoacyl peptidase n=1 Tax=Micromonospora citrea TaxID=47855 RepID=A0A1C6TRJ3_9ACTN|nr:S9 family peptidase [Micromonospora citrea]SCL44288.1 Dipeptidyl aminopeptidase/acylaminoacyl peptidase [Micromonospora citrea]
MPEFRDYQSGLRFLPTLVFSPDSARIAYVDDSSGQFNLITQGITGGDSQRLTDYTDSAIRRVAWHPGGEWLLFLADDQGNENAQLRRISVSGGTAEALTDNSKVQFAAAIGDPFSPDGRYIAYCGNDRTPADQDVLLRDVATGDVRRLFTGGGRVYPGHWAPDGSRLTATEWRTSNTDHIVYVVPLDGEPVLLTPRDGEAAYELGPWLPDGSGFLVMSNAGRQFVGLATMDAKTGELTWLDTPDWDVTEVALSADGRTLVWSVNVDGYSILRGRDLSTGTDMDMPQLPRGAATGLTISPDGRSVVLRVSTATRPWNILMIDLETGENRWLTDAKPVAADAAQFVDATLVRYPARDGLQIPGFLYRPARSEPVGVLISIHGGPAWQELPVYMYDGFYQYLVSRGVAVFAPNVRGSLGYGRAYADLVNRDWGGGDLNDFAEAVAFLRSQDWVDSTRIGVMGASYGGFSVLSCLSRLSDLNWAAGVDLYGPSNLVTLAKASPPTWRSVVAIVIGDPDADAEQLLARSPVTHADKIRAPLMVIQGANDPRVPKSESDQIVTRLRDRGVEVRYEVFLDEGHGFTRRENQERAFANAGEFLLEHLTP